MDTRQVARDCAADVVFGTVVGLIVTTFIIMVLFVKTGAWWMLLKLFLFYSLLFAAVKFGCRMANKVVRWEWKKTAKEVKVKVQATTAQPAA